MNKKHKNISKILVSLYLSTIILSTPAQAIDNIKLRGNLSNDKALELKGNIKIDDYAQKVNVSLRNTDIRQVLRMLADKANLNILIHESVSGKISLDLIDVTLNKAFEYVMTMNGLSYVKDGNTLIVASKGVSGNLGLTKNKMKPIDIKYMDAVSISDFLNSNIFNLNRPDITTAPIVITNPRTNQIYLFGSDEDIAMAEKTIEILDVKPHMKTFNVNYSNPTKVAGNLCNIVFNANYFVQGTSSSGSGSGGSTGSGAGGSSGGSSGSGSSGGAGGSSGGAGASSSGFKAVTIGSSNGFDLICGQANRQTATTSASSVGGGSASGTESTNSPTNGTQNNAMNQSNNSTDNESQSAKKDETEKEKEFSGAGSFKGIDSTLKSLDVAGYAVFANDEISQISVMGTEQQLALAEETIKNLDKRPLQAYFDISIIEVNETNTKTLDSTIDFINKYSHEIKLSSAGLSYARQDLAHNATQESTSNFNISNVLKITKGKLLANPRLIVSSNKEAKFSVMDKEPGPVSSTREPDGAGGYRTTYSVGAPVDVGITVTLLPVIKPNGEISLSVSPTYSNLKATVSYGDSTNFAQQTLTSERDVSLKDLILKDGETFVLGGLIKEAENKSSNKPSLLNVIPIIGGMFGYHESKKSRSELLFIITPHIVKDPSNVTPLPETI
ncbi:MAG: hypothetical protein WCK67_01240 [bacterium]